MEPSTFGSSYLISMVVIFGTLFVLWFVGKKMKGLSFAKGKVIQSPIQIVAARSVGSQNTLAIVEVEGKKFLIGIGRNGVTRIADLAADQS
jgi:flagellar biogenesis protein FliO